MDKEIAPDIVWTNSARQTFDTIIEYLQSEWTDREVVNFINQTLKLFQNLKKHPEMCRPSAKRKNVRIAILNKHTKMVYHFKPGVNQIEILLFWGMKQNPAKFKY